MNRALKFFKKPFVVIIIGSLSVFFIVMGLRVCGQLELLELAAYDWLIRLQPKLASGDTRITLIEIFEEDIRHYGRWPLADEAIARALKNLIKNNPRAVGLDIYRDIPVPPGRDELIDVFSKNPNIIGVMTVGEKGVPPLLSISRTDQVGFGDIIADPGGIVRRALLFLDDGSNQYSSFALRLASLYLQTEGITQEGDPDNPNNIRLNGTTIQPFESNDGGYVGADARGYQFLLDFQDTGAPFRTYSFSSLLANQVPPEAIADKVVLVGVNAQSVKDYFYTPMSRGFVETQQVSGIALHGHIVSQLLRFALDRTSPIKTMDKRQEAILILFWSLAGGLIVLRTQSVWRFSLMIVTGLLMLLSTTYFAFLFRWWIPLIPSGLSFILSAGTVMAVMSSFEKKERALLMDLFSRHVSKEIAGVIWEQREQFMNNGRPKSQKMTVTVFFSDLKGFTTTSEKLEPQELVNWLNSYMESMTQLIMDHGGVIDDYAGDGIKADFGVPLPRQNEEEVGKDAVNAITCALSMEKEMQRLNAIWTKRGLPVMSARVGIYTGTVVAGLLGSSQRLKYTTIGDTVNVAARLESYDKEVGKDILCRILIGDATLRYVHGRFQTESIGEVRLKGKDERIMVHRVLSEGTPDTQAIK